MKRVVYLLLALATFTLAGIGSSYAQEEATALEQVAVDIWPDFDRPATLVLLTMTRPANAGEQTLRLPLPPGADVNAVARISPSGDLVTDQITADESTPGVLAVTTASPQIRVEYYVPYQADDQQRQIAFEWAADLTVEELVVSVQQPAAAADFELRCIPVAAAMPADS
ncbi:MAG: hypothetical protein R3300_19500, partial [Candidatus Promineifilaceae bacterium]|nr:hypothetical protein [Candidatus Promineifilaceae bacterium]